MESVSSTDGATVSYEVLGSGPPLILIHGSLTNHNTNWFPVKGAFAEKFTVHAMDRRGRGETSATEGHSIEDEFEDVVAVTRQGGEPVFLLGHSYGAHVALGAAALVPDLVRKLVLYEPPVASSMKDDQLRALEADAAREDWEGFVLRFLSEVVVMPQARLDEFIATPMWKMIVDEAKATLGDLRALKSYSFGPQRFASLSTSVLFLYGGESPPIQLEATDALMAVIPNAKKVELTGQGHEGMLTDPGQFVDKVTSFLLSQ